MGKKFYIIMFFMFNLFFFLPFSVSALSFSSFVSIGACSFLGDPSDSESVAWLLQKVLDFIKVVGPLLVIVLSSFDFMQVILNGSDDSFAKAKNKLITRLILAALLFFIPIIVEALLGVFGIMGDPTCGLH